MAVLVASVSAAMGGVLGPRERVGAPRPAAGRPAMTHAPNSSGEAPFVFGIYPGGAAGTVGPSGETRPENPAKRLAALKRLRPSGRPFVLHLYAQYTGPGGWSAEQQVGQSIAAYGRAGFKTELALCYRPADGGSTADVAGFVQFVRESLRSLGQDRSFTSLQVTNEANEDGSPSASDGYYAHAADALVEGVLAAHHQARQQRLTRLKIGFNWAYATGDAQPEFWSSLGSKGGRRFVDAVDWVGLNAFPGTWGPALGAAGMAAGTTNFMDRALRQLRSEYMPLAGIPKSVPVQVTESGYPTGPGRSPQTQLTVMKAAIEAVYHARRTYNVTGYRWFDLRDADSSTSSFEGQYGILRDDYSPKPAFSVYRSLVASLSRP